MSFTEDELQAFTTILEQRFAVHRQEMEQAFDLRVHNLQQKLVQQIVAVYQEQSERSQQWLIEQERQLHASVMAKLHEQQEQITQVFNQEAEQKQQVVELAIDRMFATQSLGIEQLLKQYVPQPNLEPEQFAQSSQPQSGTLEIQTELPWEDLLAMLGKVLDERLILLNDSLQRGMKNLEQYISAHLHTLQSEVAHLREQGTIYSHGGGSSRESGVAVQEVLRGIEQLERVVESMQVAMTANHALLSNRLYHHQHLPLERAHPASLPQVERTDGNNSLLAQAKTRVAQGLEPGIQVSPKED